VFFHSLLELSCVALAPAIAKVFKKVSYNIMWTVNADN